MCPQRRVGLLGGTFDPPHLGHLVAAEVARVVLGLDAIHFVVAGEPWMKDRISPAEHRVRMVELAVADNDCFHANRTEIDRPGPTYTVDTLRQLSDANPDVELYFLLGTDAVAKLPDWKQGEEALKLATFVAIPRPGHEVTLEGPTLGRVRRLDAPAIDISSTDLRRRFREGGAVRYQLPAPVERYVREQGLYTPRPPGAG